MFRTSTNTDNTITAYAIIRTVYHVYYILMFIFILYRSVFSAGAIRSYSFPVNISEQYRFGGLLFFLHYTITQYIFTELFYIIIPSVLSLHDISILSVYSYISYIFRSYIYYFLYLLYNYFLLSYYFISLFISLLGDKPCGIRHRPMPPLYIVVFCTAYTIYCGVLVSYTFV